MKKKVHAYLVALAGLLGAWPSNAMDVECELFLDYRILGSCTMTWGWFDELVYGSGNFTTDMSCGVRRTDTRYSVFGIDGEISDVKHVYSKDEYPSLWWAGPGETCRLHASGGILGYLPIIGFISTGDSDTAWGIIRSH